MQKQSSYVIELNKTINKNKFMFLTILAMMSVAGLVGSDVYIPALPFMGKYFGRSMIDMQFTLSIYLLGLSIGQLIYGPLIERVGRKYPLSIGIFIYFLATLSCIFSFSYHQLIISRMLQAIGACAGLTIGRTIVSDVYNTQDAGKIFSTIFPFVGMSPAISPVIGGIVAHYFGWRATFVVIALFSLALLFLIVTRLPETHHKELRRPISVGEIIAAYPVLLFNRAFIMYAAAPCFAYIAYFAYIAQSPFIFHSHGYSELDIGFFYITLSITYILGNLLGKYSLKLISLDWVLNIGFSIFILSGFGLFLVGYWHFSLPWMVFFISMLTFANGQLIPLGIAGLMTSLKHKAGYASGLLGFLQIGSAALSAAIIGHLSHNTILGLGTFIFISNVIAGVVFFGSRFYCLKTPIK